MSKILIVEDEETNTIRVNFQLTTKQIINEPNMISIDELKFSKRHSMQSP